MVTSNRIRPLSVAGFVGTQSAGDGGIVMRRLARVELVLVYEFVEAVSRTLSTESDVTVTAEAGQTCITHSLLKRTVPFAHYAINCIVQCTHVC